MEKPKQNKAAKAGRITANALTIFVCLIILFIVINWFSSRDKGYTSYFGNLYLSVESDSMKGSNPDSFNKGDVIKVKILSDEEKRNLKVGQIITFWDNIEARDQLNTHRIIEVHVIPSGDYRPDTVLYVTQGDNNQTQDSTWRSTDKVVGVCQSKAAFVGRGIAWMQTPTGFFVSAVLPALLILVYCLVMVIINASKYSKVKGALTKDQIREQLLEELRREAALNQAKPNQDNDNQNQDVNTKSDKE